MNIDNRARIMGQDRPTITGLCFEHELKSSWQWEVGNGLARLDSCIDVLQPWFVGLQESTTKVYCNRNELEATGNRFPDSV